MKLAVLGSPDSWYFQDLHRAATARDMLTAVPFSALAASVQTARAVAVTSIGLSLADFDAVLVRTMPPGSLEQIVFRMDALALLERRGTRVVNRPKALEAAIDKYLALGLIAAAGLPVPRTTCCQTVDTALSAYQDLGRDVVVKPIFGSEGRGIFRVSNEDLALRAFTALTQLGAVLYVQEFVPHPGFDLRVLLIGDQVFAMSRHSDGDWRTNVSRGANPAPFRLTPEIERLARDAAGAVGAEICGVDLLPTQTGGWLVLEVNAVPGWRALSKTLATDISHNVLEYLRQQTRNRT
jgi:ribosomal protein S6--L-glutamate ligase